MNQIPLYGKGKKIVDWALVDEDCVDDLMALGWYRTAYGYAASSSRRPFGEANIYMHRAILDLVTGDPLQADHINGNRLDNRRANLRAVTAAQNRQNQHRPDRGVTYRADFDRWVAQSMRTYIGCFKTKEEALAAASAFRRERMPFSARDQL